MRILASGRYFRIVRRETPDTEDFRSLGDEGIDCSRRRHPRECAEGVSVWDDADYAIAKARLIGFSRGSFLAELRVPEDGTVEIAKTFGLHHYTIYYGSPRSILGLMHGKVAKVPEMS